MKSQIKNITSRLVFRITVPIILIWLILGILLYSFVRSAATDFVSANIEDDMMWLSRQTMNICNTTFDNILKTGLAANQNYVTINQNRAILAIEDFMRDFKINGSIRSDNGKTLFATELPVPEEQIAASKLSGHKVARTQSKNNLYYLAFAHFDPWGWDITLIKPADAYAAFQGRMTRVYIATSAVLSGAVVIIIFLVTWSVNSPIRRIIHRLASGGKPDYKGVYEVEYLSDAISNMMSSLEQLNKHLEDMVQERTLELAKAKEEAESATRAKSDFLARMSHEIRTPLNAVIGLTNLVLKTELAPTQKDYLDNVQEASDHLLSIINDILDFSKIEAGKFELSIKTFSLNRILEKLADMFRLKAAEKHIELFFFVHEDVPSDLEGDPTRVGQVLINLITNALKFTDQGEVIIQIQLDPETHRSAADAATIRLLFSVQDTGMGIPADRIQELFKPFTQADGSVDRMHEGTGLGLSICQRLVEKMGGKIWLESTIGKGTTFFFTIELKRTTDQEQARLLPPENLKDLNVLILDANDTSCRHLHEILCRYDCTVSSANSVQQGMDLLEQGLDNQPYDLVLMERTMPEMNGFTAAHSIRNNPKIQKLGSLPKIILMSMHELEDPSLSHNGSLGEIDGYLLKPINDADLVKTIAAAYDQGKDLAACPTEDVCREDLQGLKNLAGSRILLVEDNETNQKFIVALLSMMGLRVDVSSNGRKAVAQLKQNQQADRPAYDAVLMDIEMPVMDGYTATRIIRSDPDFKELPIIAMTAHALRGTKSKCLDAGMNDYLSKPVDEKELCSVLVKYVQPSPQSRPRQPEVEQTIDQDNWNEMPDHIPGINLQRTLYRIGGSAGLLRRILGSFLEQFADADQQIRQMMTQDHTDQAKQLIHTIKGTSGNIGAEALHVAARELERQILAGSASTTSPAMNAYIEKHRQVIDSLANLDLNHPDEVDPLAESDGPMDVDAITELLYEIEDLLKKSDSRVRHMLPKLRALIQNPQLRAAFNRLDRAIYRLDSDLALKCVSEMNAIIKVPTQQVEESPYVDER